jgi:hypothetical protein
MERMARQTRASAVLDELWAALGRDPFVIAAAVVNRGDQANLALADCRRRSTAVSLPAQC